MSKYLYLFVISIVAFINCTQEASISSSSSKFKNFTDSLFQTQVDSGRIAGAAVKVVHKGSILADQAFGFASIELSVPMQKHYSFEIGSVTKQFTAAAIIQLDEQNQLSLTDDFRDYIDFDTKGRTITIQQLLNHTSGIPSYTEIPAFWDLSLRSFPRDSLLRLVEGQEFLFEPGEALIYNNSAYFILGFIIEKVSGLSYEDYLKKHIFSRLNMTHTYYCSQSKIVPDKVYGYSFSNEGLIQKEYLDHTWPYSAGSLCSTTEDIYKWMTALHEGRILSEKAYDQLIRPLALNDGTPVRYASGIANFTDHGHTCIAHGGGINGFLSDTRYYPDEELYIICLVNTTGPMGAGALANELTGHLLAKKESMASSLNLNLDDLTGKYTGQVRGRKINISLSNIGGGLVQKVEGSDSQDTLINYQGNNTWINENDIYTVKDGVMHIDNVFGHYVLGKVQE